MFIQESNECIVIIIHIIHFWGFCVCQVYMLSYETGTDGLVGWHQISYAAGWMPESGACIDEQDRRSFTSMGSCLKLSSI